MCAGAQRQLRYAVLVHCRDHIGREPPSRREQCLVPVRPLRYGGAGAVAS